jgi:hypothetical protein
MAAPLDPVRIVLYRIAYVRTRDRLGAWSRKPRPAEDPDTMQAMVCADLGLGAEEQDRFATIVREAVEDAIAGRPPRW